MDRTSNKSTCQQLAALLLLLVSEIIRNNKLPAAAAAGGAGAKSQQKNACWLPAAGFVPPDWRLLPTGCWLLAANQWAILLLVLDSLLPLLHAAAATAAALAAGAAKTCLSYSLARSPLRLPGSADIYSRYTHWYTLISMYTHHNPCGDSRAMTIHFTKTECVFVREIILTKQRSMFQHPHRRCAMLGTPSRSRRFWDWRLWGYYMVSYEKPFRMLWVSIL